MSVYVACCIGVSEKSRWHSWLLPRMGWLQKRFRWSRN